MVQALTTDFQSIQVDKQQLLELVAQKANTLPENLQIHLGQRQVFGQTSEGLFVDELNSGRVQVIAEALQHSSTLDEANINDYLYPNQNPELEIKSPQRVLFRQESDGIISVNTVKIPPQIEAQNTQTEVLPEYNSDTVVYLNEPGDSLRKLNASEENSAAFLKYQVENFFEVQEYLNPIDKNNKLGEFEFNYDREQKNLVLTKNDVLFLQVNEGEIYAVNKNNFVEDAKLVKQLLKSKSSEVVLDDNSLNSSNVLLQSSISFSEGTSTVAKTQSNKLPNSKTKQFLQTLLKELSQKSQQVVQSFSSISRLKQGREVASTAIQLLDSHYQQTQEHSYQAEGYTISLEADNTYVVSDKVRELMRIKVGGLTGPKILSNQMNKFHHLDFDRVRNQIQKSGIEGLSNQPHQRIKQLGNLAPSGDSELINAVKVQQVKQIAMNFLATTGINSWEDGDKGNYSIESVDDDNLEIRSAKDARGVILKLSNGKLESRLEAKDFVYFQQLRNYSQIGIQSNQQVPVRPRITKAPIISDLANSNLRNLASLIAAKNVLDAFDLKSYESESFRFEKQNNTLVVKAKDGRGEIARLQNGQVTGKVLDRDVIHFSSLNEMLNPTSRSSSVLVDLAENQQKNTNSVSDKSSYTKLSSGIEIE
jgi:hypothetical protein